MSFLSIKIPQGSLGNKVVQTITKKWQTLDKARGELERHGFVGPTPPGGEAPRVDARLLENIASPDYLQTYSELTAWYGFGESMKGEYEGAINECKTTLNILGAEIKKNAKDANIARKGEKGWKAISPDDLKVLLLSNPEYQAVLLRCQEEEQKLLLLTSRMKGMFRTLALMSRNIEMKKMEATAGQGASNWISRTRNPQQTTSQFGSAPVLHPRRLAPHEEPDDPED